MHTFHDSRARYLFEAVRTGSVRAAGEKLGIVPSAVSRQISLLEEELGLALLERQRTGVVPTEAGQLVLEYYRQQLAHQHDMLAKADAMRGLHSGTVRVVSGEGFVQELMAGPVKAFRAQHPQVTLSLEVYGTNDILHRVREDEAEIGLIYYAPSDSQITVRGQARQPMHAIVAPGHPLQALPHITLAALREWPIGLLQGVYGIRQLLDNAMQAEQIRLSPVLTSNLISVLIGFVRNGQGVTLLPRCAVTTELSQGKVVAIPIEPPTLLSADVQLITRAGRELSPAAHRFLQFCVEGMQAFQNEP